MLSMVVQVMYMCVWDSMRIVCVCVCARVQCGGRSCTRRSTLYVRGAVRGHGTKILVWLTTPARSPKDYFFICTIQEQFGHILQ